MFPPRPLLTAAAMTLSLAAAAPALADCGPAPLDFGAAPTLPAMPVSVALDGERVLLGKQGERIALQRKLVWADKAGDLSPRTWADKVDWSAYATPAKASKPAPTRLYFSPEGQLCRMEQYLSIRGQSVLVGGYTLDYDAGGALAGYTEFTEASDAAAQPYRVSRRACLQRDAQGLLTTFIDDGCDDPKGPGASRHYVRNAQGQLLRVIDTLSPGAPQAVQTYNALGEPGPRYVSQPSNYVTAGDSRAPYAYAAPTQHIDRVYPRLREDLAALPSEIPGIEWRIVRIADEVPMNDRDDQSSWDPNVQTVLAQGETDAQSMARLTPAAQDAVWQAMQAHPGRILFYFDPMGRVLLTSAITPAQWEACGDPTNLAPDACGK
ncbi:hypothetical protein [Achromobacter pestifer]|nr:hypothetical protein [Achromobacter pestifer]